MSSRRTKDLMYKKKLQELFTLMADRVEITLNYLKEAILAICNNDPIELGRNAALIKEMERKSDRVHDEIIDRMYSKETLMFSRQDRLYIISSTDNVIDGAESAVRRLSSYFPVSVQELTPLLKEMADLLGKIGVATKELLLLLFKDFKASYKKIDEIEELRRNVRQIEFDFIKALFTNNPPQPNLLYYDRSIRKITKVVKMTKFLASGIRGIILKYEL
jgi:uncharacterized protein Yka (UPF0111/DUF47 family)